MVETDDTPPLLQAVLDEDENAVAALLAAGADPSPKAAPFGDLPLVNAASQDTTLGIVQRLVDAGASIEVTDEETGATPLVFAVAHKAGQVARYLVARGANVNVAGDVSDCCGRQSPLILATENNDLELARLLFARGADPNLFGDFYGRPLHYAAHDTHTEMIALLLDHGADIWFRDGDCNWTALEVSIQRKQWQAARVLYRRSDELYPNGLGTPLHALAANGEEARVEALLDSGTSVDLRDGSGKTALHWAVAQPRPLAALILAANGLETVPTARTEETQVIMTDLLLRRGADLDALDGSGDTPLHDALAWGGKQPLALAAHLIRKGANVRLKDQTGWTPLLFAARAAAPPSLLAQLFAGGADPCDAQGEWNALTYAAHRGMVANVVALIAHGVPVNVEGWSPLHSAVHRGHAEIVKLLLAAGADPNARDTSGNTPADKTTSSEILALLK